jgi:hypothetical protein
MTQKKKTIMCKSDNAITRFSSYPCLIKQKANTSRTHFDFKLPKETTYQNSRYRLVRVLYLTQFLSFFCTDFMRNHILQIQKIVWRSLCTLLFTDTYFILTEWLWFRMKSVQKKDRNCVRYNTRTMAVFSF